MNSVEELQRIPEQMIAIYNGKGARSHTLICVLFKAGRFFSFWELELVQNQGMKKCQVSNSRIKLACKFLFYKTK